MNRTYNIINLDCANCGAKIEKKFNQMDGIDSATLDFMSRKLYIASESEISAEELTEIADKVEVGIIIADENKSIRESVHSHSHHDCDGHDHGHDHDHDHGHDHDHASGKSLLIRLGLAASLFLVAMLAFGEESIYGKILFLIAYIIIGYDIFLKVPKHLVSGNIFDENLLMTIATFGAIIIGQFSEGVAVLFFYQLGEFFQHRAVDQSRRSIAEQMDLRSEKVRLLKDGKETVVDPRTISIGDRIILRPHQLLPLDSVVIKGESFMDTASITGESKPRRVNEGSETLSGYINGDNELLLEVTELFEHSTTAKLIEMVEKASSKKARVEKFITRFARVYTPIVVLLALIIAIFPPLVLGADWQTFIYRGLIFLVVSCPCALVLSIPLGFFAGLGASAKSGVVIKGGNYLEALSTVDAFVFDKTGTLTKGDFKVVKAIPEADISLENLLSIARTVEAKSTHPIARAIYEESSGELIDLEIEKFNETPGKGVIVETKDKKYAAGSALLMESLGIELKEENDQYTRVYISENNKLLGTIYLADEPKEESKSMLAALRKEGVKFIQMVSGDREGTVKAVADELALDAYFGGAMPADKLAVVENLIENEKRNVCFVGDGSNDAPVLARADIGIAMGGVGTDVAIEAADMIIMEDDLFAIPKAIKISKKTKRIVYQNIIFAIGIKVLVMIMSVFGLANMWLAVFADVGVTILAVLNALRILRIK